MSRFLRDHGGHGVLKNELFLVVGLEHQGILVETLDAPGKLYAAHQVNRENHFVLAGVIQKTVLDILRRLIHWSSPNPFGKQNRCYNGPSIVPRFNYGSGKAVAKGYSSSWSWTSTAGVPSVSAASSSRRKARDLMGILGSAG